MTNPDNLSPETVKAIDVIKKLLNLAAKAGTPEEAAAATAKATEMLVRYNLDVATVDNARPEDGKREEAKVEGGFYAHQRQLWATVANLHFCVYWTQSYVKWERVTRYNQGLPPIKKNVTKKRHALVGKVVNTRSTIAVATYLQGAIERLTSERLRQDGLHNWSSWAMSFRKGCTATVIEKLEDRREELIRDEEAKAARAAADAAAAGYSTSTAMTIANLKQAEEDANLDFLMKEPGYAARRRAERAAARAERAQRQAEEEAAYTAWAAANPEEVAKAEREARKREERNAARRTGRSYSGRDRDTTDWGAYRAGRAAAASISLDPQVDTGRSTVAGRIGR